MKVVISKQMESKNDERDRIRINGDTGFFLSLVSVKDTSVFFLWLLCASDLKFQMETVQPETAAVKIFH